MIRTAGGRRLPLTALAVVIAAGTALAGAVPAQAATAPAPVAGTTGSTTAAAIRVPAPVVQPYGFDYSAGSKFHGLATVDLTGIDDPSGLTYEYQLDRTGTWTPLSFSGYVSGDDEIYVPASAGTHLLSMRVVGTVDGVPVVGAASAPIEVRAVGGTLEYTPEVVVDGPSVTFRWDVLEALNGFTAEESDVFTQVDDGPLVPVDVTGSLTVAPGYGKRVGFDLVFGPTPTAWRYVHVDGITADAPGARPFTSTPLPSIVGTVEYGSTLSVRTGTWQPAATAYEYQWFRDGERIPGATQATRKVDGYDIGHRLTVSVRGSRDGYVAAVRTSGPTKVVAQPVITAGTPRITGNPVVGRTLTAQPGIWKPASLELGYQWKRDGKAIPGATARTYTLTEADRGHTVTAIVSAVIYTYDNQARASAGVKVR